MSTACPRTLARQAGKLRLITATPANVTQGSGTYVGIETLRRALEGLGAEVELIAPPPGPMGTLRRLWFNWRLRREPAVAGTTVVGVDMDGLFLSAPGRSMAALKGVRAEEARCERGWTRLWLSLEARLEGWRARRAALVVVTSQYAAQAAQRHYRVPPGRIRVVPELLDVAAWQALLAQAVRVPHARPVVLSVAHLYPRKDLATLLTALARLPEEMAEVRIVGDGPERRRLQRQARRLRLGGRVSFLGHISRAALAREYHNATVFCLPSRQEGFGIVLLEAMAAGLPIVAARATAIPEVAPEPECARLFPPGDAVALARTLHGLLTDAAPRAALAAAGRRRVWRYDAARVAGEFLAAIEAG